MKKLTLIAAALAAVNAFAITATKEYVDNATNATLSASKSYTDEAISQIPQGTDTNAVQSIIRKNVETNYLCTVAAAQDMADEALTKFVNFTNGVNVVMGKNASCARRAEGSIAIGLNAASESSDTSIGSAATASGGDSISIGSEATADGENSVSIGAYSYAYNDNSVVIGVNATSHGEGTVTLGKNATTADKIYIGSQSLLAYLSSLAWHPASATLSGYGITDAYTKAEINGNTVTNGGALAASKAYTDQAVSGIVAKKLFTEDEQKWQDANGGLYEIVQTNSWVDGSYVYLPHTWSEWWRIYPDGVGCEFINWNGTRWEFGTQTVSGKQRRVSRYADGSFSDTTINFGTWTAVKTPCTMTNKVNQVAYMTDIPGDPDFSTNNTQLVSTATTVSEGVNATTRAIVATWENFLDGSNVVFSITNYISGTYNLDAAKLRIMEMTNGVYREVYNSRDEILLHINDFKNTDFATATNQVIQGVSAAIADKADKAWGKYTSAGGEAPSNTVYMTAPQTVFAGGMEYERVAVGEGSVCILTTKGAPVYTQGDEGTFKFQDDGGTNYFGFAKTDSYVIGANASGISVQNHIVTINYDVTMSGVPCIWYKQAIESDVEWEQLNLPDGTPVSGASHVVSWEATPPAGRETCYINCPEAKGFFKATIEVPGSAKFMTNMPADFSGGILCTDGEHKVKINWNNGAPTLVPAN